MEAYNSPFIDALNLRAMDYHSLALIYKATSGAYNNYGNKKNLLSIVEFQRQSGVLVYPSFLGMPKITHPEKRKPKLLTAYTFLVRGKREVIKGYGYVNALNRVLNKNQNKFIHTKHARKMDLISAKKEAQVASKSKKGFRYYAVVDNKTGEVDFSSIIKASESAAAAFVNGKEVPLTESEKDSGTVPVKNLAASPSVEAVRGSMSKTLESQKPVQEVIKLKNKKEMKTMKTIKKDVKVAAKKAVKVAAKKAVKVVAKKAVKHINKDIGKSVQVSASDMIMGMKKGNIYRAATGARYQLPYLMSVADKNRKREMFVTFTK